MFSTLFLTSLVLLSLTATTFGTTPSPPSASTQCSNSAFELTPSIRQEILDKINSNRQLLKEGNLLLDGGEYALPAQNMPDLTWSCEEEENIQSILTEQCNNPSQVFIDKKNYTWLFQAFDFTTDQMLSGMWQQFLPTPSVHVYLSEHAIFEGNMWTSFASIFSDKAQTIGCALQSCNNWPASYGTSLKSIMCRITPSLEFGDEIYQVSSSSATNYQPPSEDVKCDENENANMNIFWRNYVLERVNEIREKVSQGNYLLENGQNALQASSLNNLIWSCEEEQALKGTFFSMQCADIQNSYNPETDFQKSFPINFMEWAGAANGKNKMKALIKDFLDAFFVSNPNLNFLSESSVYGSQFPAAFALSDNAQTIACTNMHCVEYSDASPFPSNKYIFVCRVSNGTALNENLYNHV